MFELEKKNCALKKCLFVFRFDNLLQLFFVTAVAHVRPIVHWIVSVGKVKAGRRTAVFSVMRVHKQMESAPSRSFA